MLDCYLHDIKLYGKRRNLYTSFENIVTKGEMAQNKQFLYSELFSVIKKCYIVTKIDIQ